MDSMDVKVIKSGFSAVNENLTDIAKFDKKVFCQIVYFADGCLDQQLLYANGKIRRDHRYGE